MRTLYTKTDPFDWSLPIKLSQHDEQRCPHCHHTVLFPILEEHVNWREIAEHYKSYMEDREKAIQQMFEDIRVMQDDLHPIQQYIQNQQRSLVDHIKKHFNL